MSRAKGRPDSVLEGVQKKRVNPLTAIRQWRTLGITLVETRRFTRSVTELLTDEEYRELQLELAERPDAGAVIPGTGGLRKLRWLAPGRGKRGGLRVIYLYRAAASRILLFELFAKSERTDLSAVEREALRRIVEREDG